MRNQAAADSYWLDQGPEQQFEPLDRDISVDVAVVGAGITGLSTAINVLETGRSVAVIEADRVGRGTSGHTTAKLTAQHGLKYASLVSNLGRRAAQQYADANQAAIEEVANRIDTIGIEADFERTAAYVYTTRDEESDALEEEAEIASELGLPAEYVSDPSIPFPMAGALRFRDQAQFHPGRYLLGLAEAVDAHPNGFVFERTRATAVASGPPVRIATNRDRTVSSADIVLATLFPIADRTGYFTRMHPSRAYLVVADIADPPPEGMYLSTDERPWTFRGLPGSNGHQLLVGGQSQTMADDRQRPAERYRRCVAFAREHFPVEAITYRWSAHDYVPVDGIPFIGNRGPVADNVYVGTGFNKWGMTGGTAAGIILAGLIDQDNHPWAPVFDPMRLDVSRAGRFLRENLAVGRRWVGDRFRTETSAREIRTALDPGEGAVFRHDGRPMAVARDATNELHVQSAVCPHLGCLVEWNDLDETWDCPCHGSRFDIDGTMRYGPSVDDLPPREL